jgi:hypothetical protein
LGRSIVQQPACHGFDAAIPREVGESERAHRRKTVLDVGPQIAIQHEAWREDNVHAFIVVILHGATIRREKVG